MRRNTRCSEKDQSPGLLPASDPSGVIYAQLGHQREARSAVEELLGHCPGYNIETHSEESRRNNIPEHRIRRSVAALRKAGLPEEFVQ